MLEINLQQIYDLPQHRNLRLSVIQGQCLTSADFSFMIICKIRDYDRGQICIKIGYFTPF